MAEHYVSASNLCATLIELDPVLVEILKEKFPRSTVLMVDALVKHFVEALSTVVFNFRKRNRAVEYP